MSDTVDEAREREQRDIPLAMSPDEFREAGHALIDQISEFLATLPERPVTPGLSPDQIWSQLPGGAIPDEGTPPSELLPEAANLLM
ncbi:MAG: aspartate aminotransferase family protein, partial [Chloroflexota bacterium]